MTATIQQPTPAPDLTAAIERARVAIRAAERDLRRVLSRGERRDLLSDQFDDWSREQVLDIEEQLYAGPDLGPVSPGFNMADVVPPAALAASEGTP